MLIRLKRHYFSCSVDPANVLLGCMISCSCVSSSMCKGEQGERHRAAVSFCQGGRVGTSALIACNSLEVDAEELV